MGLKCGIILKLEHILRVKNAVFWDVMPSWCSCKNWHLRGTNCLHLHGEKLDFPWFAARMYLTVDREESLLQLWGANHNIRQSNSLLTVSPRQHMDMTIEIQLPKALFPIHHEVQPHCKPGGLRFFHPEDGGYMFL
jgi:hypothetical protein